MKDRVAIKLVVFDWAGTTIDFGSFAPADAFVRLFEDRGVRVTTSQARRPMGLAKRDHIVAMLSQNEVATEWQRVHAREWTTADVDAMYAAFAPLQMQTLANNATLVPDLLEVIAALRSRGIQIGGTTGYFTQAAEAVRQAAAKQGFTPDCSFHADDVPAGRPAPWMIHRNMEAMSVYPPSAVVKVGDTVPDIEEGLAAGVWSVGVAASSSEIGLTVEQFAALSPDDRHNRLAAVRQTLTAAGAHAVIDTLAELPALIERLQQCGHPAA